ncbi:MAG: trehalose-phosphatase [Candidatus Solibacter sp.]
MMRYLLSPASRDVLEQLAGERTLCAFDFDGTLSPIVDHPGRAGIREQTRMLLRQVAALYPCIIVSGRARADLVGRLAGTNVERAIGNHGAENETTPPRSMMVAEWRDSMNRELGKVPGLWVEDKGLSLAVHYRHSSDKAGVRRRILAAARRLPDARLVGGKQVVNLMPDRASNKGGALAAERTRLGCNWIIYVGDDENDEDAFALEGNVVGVRIGRKQRSHARYYLRAQSEVDKLLEVLVNLRAPERATH